MKQSAHKIGAVLYVLWGLLHIFAAYRVYASAAGIGDPGVAARIAQGGWNLGVIAIFAILVGAKLNWNNDRLGYWLNLGVVSAADVGFIVLVLLPGYIPLAMGLPGPILWLLAVAFSTLGLKQETGGTTPNS